MGCDIHAYVAARLSYEHETDFWVEADVSIDRNYDLFAHMAGVRNRNNVTPIALPRGVMKDLVFMPDWITSEDAHTHSWLTFDEYKTAVERANAGTSAKAVIAYMQVFEDAKREPRLVFCFDN